MSAKNCLSCALKRKVEGWDTNGGDFYRCAAVVVYPAFVMTLEQAQDRPDRVMRFFNLNLFREPAPTAPCLDRDCPLWSDAA